MPDPVDLSIKFHVIKKVFKGLDRCPPSPMRFTPLSKVVWKAL